jgi:hypothetical protein
MVRLPLVIVLLVRRVWCGTSGADGGARALQVIELERLYRLPS